MIKTPYRIVFESFDSDPDVSIEVDDNVAEQIQNSKSSPVKNVIASANENYENPPDEFVEYKYNDKLNDVRKDIDYFKTRLDESESNEAKQKYLKILNELIEEEKKLICVTTTSEKHDLDKKDYVAKQVSAEV